MKAPGHGLQSSHRSRGRAQEARYPASAYSRAFWLAAQLLPPAQQQRYHIVRSYRFQDAVDADRLERALKALLAGHYHLRSRYLEQHGSLWQVVGGVEASPLRRAVAHSAGQVQEQVQLFAAKPFDLARDLPAAFAWIENTADGSGTLVAKFHHIALSGADLDAVIGSIGELYRDDLAPRMPVGDSVAALEEWSRHEAELYAAYQPGSWASRLQDLPEHNSLRVRGLGQAEAFTQQARIFHLPEALFEQLSATATQLGSSAFDICKVAWGMTLSHCLGSRRVLINFPVDVRRKSMRQVKGAMINTLFHLHRNEGSLADALAGASLRQLGAAAVCLPSAVIENECGLDASAYHFTIAQSNLGIDGPRLASAPEGSYLPCTGASELLLVCSGRQLVYQHTLGSQVGEDFLFALHQVFVGMLSAALDDPQRDIGSVPGFDVAGAVAMGRRSAVGGSVLNRAIAMARRQPAAVAVVHNGARLSYGQLVRAAAACADDLKRLPQAASRNVGVLLPRGVELAVAMLGIWMADMTFVPLDTAQPMERLATIAADAELAALISASPFDGLLHSDAMRIDPAQAGWLSTGKPLSAVPLAGGDYELAYLIYTSGSTGTPKGVAQTHRTIDNLIDWESRQSSLPADANVAQLAAVGFDVSVQEMAYAFANGYALHVVDDEIKLSPRRLAAFMREQRIQRSFLPTALLEGFCRAAMNEGIELPLLANITVAGEALKLTRQITRFFERHPQISLFNEYGPTETHVTLVNTLGAARHIDGMSSIGRPISNTAAYVLGEQGWPVPAGMVGELYLGGDGVALGYWGREELSAQRFVGNGLPGDASARYPLLYRTGDRVRILPDGNFQFVGRADHQVKINGHRVELAEIECVLNEHAAIAQSTVLLHGESGRRHLIACYVAATDIDEAVLRQHVATRLPDYMLPAAFVRFDTLPLNANGKVDKAALSGGLAVCRRAPVAPACSMEVLLCELWSRQLGLPAVGVEDDFFDLGGDSLGALSMVEALSGMFGRACSLAQFYQWRTIAKVLEHMAGPACVDDRPTNLLVPLRRREGRRKLYLFHSGRGGAEVYHELAQAIDADVYGVDSLLMYRDDDLPSLDALCDLYAAQLRAHIGSHETVVLGGWSFGGLLAYKVAERLRTQVQGLVLIDTATVEAFKRLQPLQHRAWSERMPRYEGARGEQLHARLLRAAQCHEALYRAAAPCIGLPGMPILYFSAQLLDDEYRSSAAAIPRSPEPWRRQHTQMTAIEIASTHNRILNEAGAELAEAINAFCRQLDGRRAIDAVDAA